MKREEMRAHWFNADLASILPSQLACRTSAARPRFVAASLRRQLIFFPATRDLLSRVVSGGAAYSLSVASLPIAETHKEPLPMEHARYAPFVASSPGEEAARRNHDEGELVTESFWRTAAASLPPHVRRKYIHLFEAAEQYEPVMGFIADACGKAWRAAGPKA
jgi:hypothetical protein